MKRFICASASPRRREILASCGYDFEVIPSEADESIDEKMTPAETVMELSKRKALSVSEKHPGAVVFGCDTIVVLGNTILGKPRDEENAKNMLRMLSGKTHEVMTGVTITDRKKSYTFHEVSEVTFYELSEETIESYVASLEPMDKAGSYGIQGLGCVLVKGIKGDYFSIVGLPIAKTARVLSEFEVYGKIDVK